MCPWETESDDPIASKIVPRERRDGRQLKVLAALRGSQHPCDALVFRRFYADPPPALRSADQHLLHLPVSLLGSQASQEEPHFRPEYPLCPLRATLTTWVPASRDSCRHLLLEPGILSALILNLSKSKDFISPLALSPVLAQAWGIVINQ